MLWKQDKSGKRRRFGERHKAWLTVETTTEGNAYLRGLYLGGDTSLETEKVIAALDDHYGIVDGIDRSLLDRILAQARREPEREYFNKQDLLIASNIVPRPPVDGYIEYKFLKNMSRCSRTFRMNIYESAQAMSAMSAVGSSKI